MAKKDEEKTPHVEEKDAPIADAYEGEDEEEEDEDEDEPSDEEDGDEEDEDEDEEDDEELAAAEAKGLHDHALPPAEPEDPSWWLPHAVLAVLVTLGVLGFFGVFNKVLRPLLHKDDAPAAAEVSATPATTAPAPAPRPQPQVPPPTMKPPSDAVTYGAKHLLVQYKGSMRSPPTITRTKDEAKTRAGEALKKIKSGTKFDDVVDEYSDEPGAKQRHGDLGKFQAGAMDPQFFDAVQKLKVGDVSGLVETPFGYHVILRTQ